MQTELQRLQNVWYAKLRKTGFVDIEGGRDLNVEDASTLPGPSRDPGRSGCVHFIQLPDEAPSGTDALGGLDLAMADALAIHGSMSFADTPAAQGWRVFAQAAHELPRGRDRAFLLDVSEVGCLAAHILKKHRLTRRRARTIFDRFCRDICLTPHRMLKSGGVRRRA